MFLVAVAELRTPLEVEAAALARDLGAAPYDARLALSGVLPAVVLTTADGDRARDQLSKLRARGQGAVLCDTREVVPADRMVSMRRFRFDPEAILAPEVQERLPFVDVLCCLRAMLRTRTTTTEEVRERKIAVGAAVMTGGLVSTRSVKQEVTSTVEEREQVLFLFRRSGARPWLLQERQTQYTALGDDLQPTTPANFATTIRLLRARAPTAAYDERLLRPRHGAGGSPHNDLDVAAHLLAAWFAEIEREKPPYRRS